MQTKVSVEEAFEIFEDPRNLARITPPWLQFRMAKRGAGVCEGAEFEYRIAWLGVPLQWTSVIEEYFPPFQFVDVQKRGPYRFWRHKHMFHPSEEGTIVSDEVVYALPLGPLGRLVHGLAVKRQLEEIFRYRQAAIGEMLGGAVELEAPVITRGDLSTEAEEELAHHGTDRRH